MCSRFFYHNFRQTIWYTMVFEFQCGLFFFVEFVLFFFFIRSSFSIVSNLSFWSTNKQRMEKHEQIRYSHINCWFEFCFFFHFLILVNQFEWEAATRLKFTIICKHVTVDFCFYKYCISDYLFVDRFSFSQHQKQVAYIPKFEIVYSDQKNFLFATFQFWIQTVFDEILEESAWNITFVFFQLIVWIVFWHFYCYSVFSPINAKYKYPIACYNHLICIKLLTVFNST